MTQGMTPAPSSPARAQIGFGQVRHTRLRPARHAFHYGSYFWLLPMRALARAPQPIVRRNTRGWLSFHDADHGEGGPNALAWIDGLLRAEGLWQPDLADGEVWLQAYPRVLGYVFKPVSFWYVHRADGALHAIVAEVNNTFGERHCYVLAQPDGTDGALAWGQTLKADKVFHVSPFCDTSGQYRFRFMRTPERLIARVDHDDAEGPLLETAISGELRALDAASVRHAIVHWPFMTFGVVARIHWQALRVWLKKVPFFRKPAPPTHFITGPHQGPSTP